MYVAPDGTRYEGSFVEGQGTGLGRMSYPDGTVYEGRFENFTYIGPAD
jgi:hypothetical protein